MLTSSHLRRGKVYMSLYVCMSVVLVVVVLVTVVLLLLLMFCCFSYSLQYMYRMFNI